MPSKRLMGAWIFFDLALLAAGAISILMSILWKRPDLMTNMVIDNTDLTAGMVLGIFLIATFVLSIGAIIQRNHVTVGLVMLNWMLIIDMIVVLVVGTFVWFFTLQERDNFHKVYSELPVDKRIAVQDKFSCCGYFNSSDLAEVGGFCSSQEFITNLTLHNFDDPKNVTEVNLCIKPITAFADVTLNHIFSTVYGFMAIVIGLFLASLCVIKKRQEDERFKKIDAKRGGHGFA